MCLLMTPCKLNVSIVCRGFLVYVTNNSWQTSDWPGLEILQKSDCHLASNIYVSSETELPL